MENNAQVRNKLWLLLGSCFLLRLPELMRPDIALRLPPLSSVASRSDMPRHEAKEGRQVSVLAPLYTILCYTMLCYAMLCYAMLRYAMLCYAILYYTLLYSTLLYPTLPYSTLLYSTLLYYTILYSTHRLSASSIYGGCCGFLLGMSRGSGNDLAVGSGSSIWRVPY